MRASRSVIPIGAGLLCFAFATQPLSSDSASPTEGAGSIYITHVTLIDTQSGRESRDQTVVISGDRISEVKDSKGVKPPAGAKVVGATGKYLIPGLWDMHVHGTRFDSTLPLYIANGVTGVREMFGPPDANKFRADLAAKHLIAPHIYLGSPIVDGKPPVWPNSITVETADEARRAVDEQKQRGADFIKVYSLLSREAYFAIVDEARRQNIPVDGHVPNSVTVSEATAAKQRTIEHLFGMELACSSREKDLRPKFLTAKPIGKEWEALRLAAWQSYSDERCKGLFAELRKNGSWPVPTLTVRHSFGLLNDPQFTSDNRVRYFSGELRDWMTGKADPSMKEWSASEFGVRREIFTADSRLTGELFRAGVPMLAGTDAGNAFCFPGFGLHDELALLVESGLTPLAALQAATLNPAMFMNAADRYGSISKGKIADLVLLNADPLQDIHNTSKISEVFLDGKEFNRTALDGILKTAETEASASDQLPTSVPQPAPEMQSLAKALEGRWAITEKYEPDEWTPNGGTGYGEEVWRRGTGGFTFMEEVHDYGPAGESFGLALSWWDKDKGLQGMWCAGENPKGCDLNPSTVLKWDGKQFVFDTEFLRGSKTIAWHEVFSDITPTSFIQTADIGEKGGPLKRWLTIHATRVQEKPMEGRTSDSAEAEIRTAMAERLKASLEGDSDKASSLLADEYLQTDISGHVQDKATWFKEYFNPIAELIRAGKFRWEVYDQKDLQFHIYGDSAAVVGVLEAKGAGARWVPQSHTWEADPNASFSGALRFTHVYIKRNGKWLLAALHNAVPFSPPSK